MYMLNSVNLILLVAEICISADAAGMQLPDHLPVVGVLHQPCSQGNRQDIWKVVMI